MIRRLAHWIGIAVAAAAALGIVAYGVVYALSEHILGRIYKVPTVAVPIPTEPADIIEGHRLALVHGCFNDCHGSRGEGRVMFDQPAIARIVAPNLTSAVRSYSDVQLVAIIRRGVRPGGRSVLAMPSEAFVTLTDAELGRILAYMKSLPVIEGPGPSVSLGPVGRIGVVAGKLRTAAQLITEDVAPTEATNEEATRGRYLAQTTCAPCHGSDLRGASNPEFTSPSLEVVAAYSPEAFTELLRKGMALGGRELPVMSPRARQNLSYLTDAEITALYDYLHALPAVAQH
jgi:mono/diheme cytochrome c family protein